MLLQDSTSPERPIVRRAATGSEFHRSKGLGAAPGSSAGDAKFRPGLLGVTICSALRSEVEPEPQNTS